MSSKQAEPPHGDETKVLRRCLREIAAMSKMSAAWRQGSVAEVAEDLCRLLRRALPAAFVHVRITGALEAAFTEVAGARRGSPTSVGEMEAILEPILKSAKRGETSTIANPFGRGTLRLSITPLGIDGDCGMVVAASRRPDFPNEADQLLLGVAAAHATAVLRQKQAEVVVRRREAESAGFLDEPADESRMRLAAIVESSNDAIISQDLDGTIASWNRAAQRLYGHAPEEIVGRHISTLLPPGQQDEFEAILERLKRGERVENYETVRVAKGGNLVNVSLTISLVRDATGRIIGVSKIARDITDRLRTTTTLEKQGERLRLLWEAAAVLLTADNPNTMLQGLFRKIGPHLGVDTYFNFVVSENADALLLGSCAGVSDETTRALARLEFGQAVCGTVALHRKPIVAHHIQQSDDPKVQLVKALGIRAYACNPLIAGERLLGTLSFASRTKDAFEPDDIAFMETICRYATMSYERLRLLNELTDADERKDEFLAVLAHELRNPLAPIRNAVRTLRLEGPDLPRLQWNRDVIDRQVEHLTRLIDDLLDVSRITHNTLELRKQEVELADVVNGAVESVRPAIERAGHELTVVLPQESICLDGDLVRLSQVFLNLLSNAAKYTERGGRISLTAERQGDDVVVRVKDTGVGIHPAHLPRLFDMFFQVDRTLERSQGGLGIGLSLVRRLVELHGGTVEARSDGLGTGSEFVVRLPVLAEMAGVPHVRASADRGARATRALRILVVDDNEDAANTLAMLLGATGHHVHTAHDGLEALMLVEQFRHEVVLLDIAMPGLNGLEACRRLRSEAWGKDLVLIALTGWGNERDRRRTFEAGFDAHLVKPVDPSELIKLLASASSKRPQFTTD